MKVRLRDPKSPKKQTHKFRPLRFKYNLLKKLSIILAATTVGQAIYIYFNNL